MQTFLPYASFTKSAKVLDRQRLGKQRLEARQLLAACLAPATAWGNHAAARMWRGHEGSLLLYGKAICEEWRSRGYQDQQLPWMEAHLATYSPSAPQLQPPPWLGCFRLHQAYRSNLLRKCPAHYRQFWPCLRDDLPYVWPVGKEVPDRFGPQPGFISQPVVHNGSSK